MSKKQTRRMEFEQARDEVRARLSQGDKLLSKRGVADRLDMSVSNLDRLRSLGLFPKPFRIGSGSGQLRWFESQIADFLIQNQEVA